MGIFRWRDERHEIANLTYEIEGIEQGYAVALEKARELGAQHYDSLHAEMRSFTRIPREKIDRIETAQRIRQARAYRVPLPPLADEGVHWQWSLVTQGYHLTEEGHRYLRHEISREREIQFSPLMAWGALAISFVSLLISGLDAVFG